MKKLLLSVGTILIGTTISFAQLTANTFINAGQDDVAYLGGTAEHSWNNNAGVLELTVTKGAGDEWVTGSIGIYNIGGDGSDGTIDLTNDAHKRIRLRIDGDANTVVRIDLQDQPAYTTVDASSQQITLDATVGYETFVLDLSLPTVDWAGPGTDQTAIGQALLYINPNTTTSADIQIDSIVIGDLSAIVASIEEDVVDASLSVSPNPASDEVNVAFEAAGDVAVSLSDIVGNTIASAAAGKGTNSVSFNTSGLSAGLYIVTVATGDGVVTRKIVVE